MTPDIINGIFEFLGGIFLMENVNCIIKDKALKGVSWKPTVFFTLWGIWNLYYYPHLDQWFSFAGGLFIVIINTMWLGLIFYYRVTHENNEKAF